MKNLYFKKILESVKFHKYRSIFMQNFLLCLMLFTIPIFFMNIFFGSFYYQKKQSQMKEEFLSAVFVADKIFSSAKTNATAVFEPSILTFIESDWSSFSTDTFSKSSRDISQVLQNIKISNDYIIGSYIISEYNNTIITNSGITNIDSFYDKHITDKINPLFSESQEVFVSETYINSSPQKCIVISMPIYPQLKNSGQYILLIDYKKFEKEIYSVFNNNYAVFELKMSDNSIIKISNNKAEDKNYNKCFSKESELPYLSYQYKFSSNIFNKNNLDITVLLTVFMIISVFFTFLLAFFTTLKTTRPIGNIIDSMDKFPEWIDNQKITKEKTKNEIAFITETLSDILDTNKQYKQQTAIRVAMLKKAQAIALQSQINPHFIFNTLEAINLSVIEHEGHKSDSSKMITAFSSLLRDSFKTSDTVITLEKEIKMAKEYSYIQMFRYGELFDIEWDIDEETLSHNIIKIIIQPIIENAIYHGIKPAEKKCTIKIKTYIKNNTLYISVSNNGIPIKKEVLKQLETQLSSTVIPEDEHIGVLNVHSRIRLAYGEPYGIKVKSTEESTEFILSFPL